MTTLSPRRAVLAAVGAVALIGPASAGATPIAATYRGKTSQGRAFTFKFVAAGKRQRFAVSTSVTGSCPVTGLSTATTMSTGVGTGGFFTIKHGPWFFEQKASTYDIRLGGTYPGGTPRSLSGRLVAQWNPGVDNVPQCTTPLLTWMAKLVPSRHR